MSKPDVTLDPIDDVPLLTLSHAVDLVREKIPGASRQMVETMVKKGVALPESAGGTGNPKMFRIEDGICIHHAASWIVAAGEPTLGRILGHNAGAFLRGLGLPAILGAMAEGRSVLPPMIAPSRPILPTEPALTGCSATLLPPAYFAGLPAEMWGTKGPWPDLRDSLSVVIRKLHEIVTSPKPKRVARVFHPTALASKALAEVARLSSLTLPEPNKD